MDAVEADNEAVKCVRVLLYVAADDVENTAAVAAAAADFVASIVGDADDGVDD